MTDKAPDGEDISTRRYVYTVDTSYEYDVEEVQLDRGGVDWIYHYKTKSIKNEKTPLAKDSTICNTFFFIKQHLLFL